MATTRYCEFINAREFASVFTACANEAEINYDSFKAPKSAILEVVNFLEIGFGFIPNPECTEDDCGCCKCIYNISDRYFHDDYCQGQNEPAGCRFGLMWYEIPQNLDYNMIHEASLKALRKMGANYKGGYRISGSESPCSCGKCDRVDLEIFEKFLMDEFEVINTAESSKKENTGLGMENAARFADIIRGKKCVMPDSSVLAYDASAEKVSLVTVEGTASYYCFPNIEEVLASYGSDSMSSGEEDLFAGASKFTGAKRYPNSTIDAIWDNGESSEAVSYKSNRATFLDSSTNHVMRLGASELTDEEIVQILEGKHLLNRKFKTLNDHYSLPYSQRPAHHMKKNNRYMSLISEGCFIVPEGGFSANGSTIHLPNENDNSKAVLSIIDRLDGFPLRFGAENAEMILNLALTAARKNTIGFKGWKEAPQMMRNGEFHDASQADDLLAAKHLLLTKRTHPSEGEGRNADCVRFLAKSPSEGITCLLELRYNSEDFLWRKVVENLSLDTPSGSRDRPQLGILRMKNGKAYPFISLPLKLRLEHGFKPENYSFRG